MTDRNNTKSAIRAFIAVPIEDALRSALARVQSRLKACGADARWIDPDNIHMTLVFLGDISENTAAALADEIDRMASRISSFVMEAKGIGFFGRPSSPRVIWAGLHGDTDRAAFIQQQAMNAARTAGCSPDEKPFSPHLTFGRIRSGRNIKPLIEAVETKKKACFGKLAVRNILLMKSRLAPGGPEYSILHGAKLGP